jgi:transposase-like protein
MIEFPTDYGCPNCGSTDEPRLVVYGSGLTGQDWVLRCRTCNRDWSDFTSVRTFRP